MRTLAPRPIARAALVATALLTAVPALAGLLDDIRTNPGSPFPTTVERPGPGPAPGTTDVSDLPDLPIELIPDETLFTSCRVIATAVVPKRAVITCADDSVSPGAPVEYSLPTNGPDAALMLQLAESSRFAAFLGGKQLRLVGRLSDQGVLKEGVSLQGGIRSGYARVLDIEYSILGGSIATATCGGPCNVVVSLATEADPEIAAAP